MKIPPRNWEISRLHSLSFPIFKGKEITSGALGVEENHFWIIAIKWIAQDGRKNIVNLPKRLQKLYGSVKNVFSFFFTRARKEERKKKVEIYTTFPLSHEQSFPKHQHNLKKEKSEHENDFLLLGERAKNWNISKIKTFHWNVRFRLFFVVSETASGGGKSYDNNVKWGCKI